MSNKDNLELVLVADRKPFTQQMNETMSSEESGLWGLDLERIPPNAFGFLPRHLIDAKKTGDEVTRTLSVARDFPQLISYLMVADISTDTYLVYSRKGKEVGLLGKSSIGVGGHIDVTDAITVGGDEFYSATLQDIILHSVIREVKEEIGFDLSGDYDFDINDILYGITSHVDVTAMCHIGLHACLYVNKDDLVFDESEYLDVRWLSLEDLIASRSEVDYEPWSKLIIDALAK